MADDLRALIFRVESDDGTSRTPEQPGQTGWIGLVASERGIRLLALPSATYEAAMEFIRRHYPDVPLAPDDVLLLEAARQIRSYLHGGLRDFSVPLDLRGHTSFALEVWAATGRIPYGETRTYRWIAAKVGGGTAVYQAVGAALGSNPVPLIIPCHRVIGSDGSLHGYAGGLEMKARLLALETGQAALAFD